MKMITVNEESMPMIKMPMGKPMSSRQSAMAMTHRLHLKGPVTDPEDYVEWVETIRDAGEHDTIEFHINSPGGNVYSAIELIHAFADTKAHIHVVLSGIVASAGTILMTVGDSFEISPYTTFMFHNYSGGTIGKGNEMAIKMDYEREWSKMFMHDIYEGLLTTEEIDQMLDGRDFWLSAEDVGDRLSAMIEFRQERMENLMNEVLEELTTDLESMTKAELLKFAKDHDIKVDKKMKKADIIKMIKEE